MTQLTVLYADDHIPDDSIPGEKGQIKEMLKKKYHNWPDDEVAKLADCYYYARQVINVLRDAAYNVRSVNTYQAALELVEREHFDISIIDLGWYNDDTLPDHKKSSAGSAGWDIYTKLEEADKARRSTPTLQIVYSKRFVDEPGLSIDAAQNGALPFFKTYQDTNALALKAVVGFLKKHLADPSSEWKLVREEIVSFGKLVVSSIEAAQIQLRQWFVLTLVFVAISLTCVLAGVISAIVGNAQVGAITSIGSIVTGVVSSLLFVQLQRSQKEANKKFAEALRLYKETLGRLDSHERKLQHD